MGYIVVASHDTVLDSNKIVWIAVERYEHHDAYGGYAHCGDSVNILIFHCDYRSIPQDDISKEIKKLDIEYPSRDHTEDEAISNMILRGLLDIWKRANSGETVYIPETFKDLIH